MEVTKSLQDEHVAIERVLDALTAWAAEVMRDHVDARAELSGFLVYCHRFVDGLHHAKEEEVLFRALVELEDPACNELVGNLLREHERGRVLLGPLEDLAYQLSPWNADEHEDLAHLVADYAGFLRAHIEHENRALLPLVRTRLSDATRDQVLHRFRQIDARHAEHVAQLRELATRLCDRYCPRREHSPRRMIGDEPMRRDGEDSGERTRWSEVP